MPLPVTLIGQHAAETLLARAVLRGQVGHAYLFLGPSGSGKATAARLFAQAVNCERQPAMSGVQVLRSSGVQEGEPPRPPENRGELAGTQPASEAPCGELSPSPLLAGEGPGEGSPNDPTTQQPNDPTPSRSVRALVLPF